MRILSLERKPSMGYCEACNREKNYPKATLFKVYISLPEVSYTQFQMCKTCVINELDDSANN